jgi:CubicO group peptidase (beta-lactamase class C family)
MAAESSESSSARRAALRAFCSALGVAAALTFSAPRSDAQTDSANPLSEAVVASIDKLFLENRPAEAPGCAVGAALGERVLIRRGYGLADMEHGAPITPDTPFLTASVAKQVTAFAIQLLVEDGRLSLDDDVRRFVPELPQFEGGPITLRHLLNQTSGVRDAFVLLYLAGWRYDDVFTQDDVLRMTFRQSALNAPPGAQWSYSNTNYILLGEVVRRVSGKTLPDFAQERIFGPLGMTNSRLVDEYGALVAHRARSYVAKDDGYVNYAASDSVAGSSNFVTTINDVMLWQRNLSTGRVGGPRVVQRMAEIGRLNDGGATSYASGLFVRDYRGARSVDHGGALPGYRAQLLRLPEHDFSVSVLCNASDRNAGFLARRVADLLIGDRLAPGEPQSAPEQETSAPVDRGTLRAYVGE